MIIAQTFRENLVQEPTKQWCTLLTVWLPFIASVLMFQESYFQTKKDILVEALRNTDIKAS